MNDTLTSLPKIVKDCLSLLQDQYKKILGNNLLGIYVHGSIAMNCFNPESSDIDVLVVVKKELPLETKVELGQFHVMLSNKFRKNIELSVILQNTLVHFAYPTPQEFHYSDEFKDSFIKNTVDLVTKRTDYDLAAHFIITKKYGITLFGKSAQVVFPKFAPAFYIDSISRDAEWSFNNIRSGSDEGYGPVPRYAVLNFCRILAFIREGLVLSKKSGGEWALTHLPNKYHSIIQEALNEYQKTGSSQKISIKSLKKFAEYSFDEIKRSRAVESNKF